MSQRPVQQVLAGATLLKSREPVTRLPFIVQGRIDSVLHMQGDDGGRVIPVSWSDGETVLLSQRFMGRPGFVDLIAGTNASLRWACISARAPRWPGWPSSPGMTRLAMRSSSPRTKNWLSAAA